MKLSAVLKVASLTLPAIALFPAMAFANNAEDVSLGSLASAGGSSVRASLSANGLLGPLSPMEGAVVTGLVVFALGCVVAILVARKLDRTDVPAGAKLDPDSLFEPRAVSPLYSYQAPAAFARAEATARIDSSRQLPAPAPSSPRLPGASSRRLLVADDGEPEPTLTAWPPRGEGGEISGERPVAPSAQNDTRSVERSGVVPSAHARGTGLMGAPMGAHSTGIVVDAEVLYEPSPGADPDATTQFVRGRNLSLVTAHTPSRETRTVLPPAIRPIPISAPRAIAGANVSDLSFDDSPTEIGLPSFEEVEREISKASEIRALSGHHVNDPNETQAFLLLKSS